MLAVSKLTPGQESYYERSVAAGLDDYYAGRGESPGIWTGRAAAALGLEGVVSGGRLGVLIRGHHPLTNERLRRHPKARTITVEKIDPHTNERRTEQKKLSPVAGFDLVFSVPKSVSLLHALGDEETRRAVGEAHLAAWQSALAYLEDEACIVRRGKNGVVREHGGGFVAAAYQHRTSRAQDPHLHTHVIVANMAQSPTDDKWRALDGEAILKTYRLAAGYLYEAHLRAELSRSLGVEWEVPVKGWADLRGLPEGVLREFSTRRLQVVERIDESGDGGFYASQRAAVETREQKEHVDLARLREDWWARAAEHGLGRRELARLLQRTPWRDLGPRELREIASQMLSAKGLTARRTAFSEPELVMAWAEAHAQGASSQRVRRLCARFVEIEGVERVGELPAPGRSARYSTRELLRIERAALALAERGRACGAPSVSEEIIEGAVLERARASLTVEQEAMVRAVCATTDRVVCVVGLAGSGKTTATRVLAEAFATAGISVLGASPSGVAAEKLQNETGIPATTLHRLLGEAEYGLPPRCVVVIDEAGMAETRILAPALQRVEEAGGKAVLIGDPHQLPAVGAGGLFAGIVERRGAVELAENRRQRDAVEREALNQIRRGFGRDYLAYAERRERLVVSDDPLTTRTRLLADWWSAARSDLAANVMITLRRRDVAELNALARALMETHGRLGRERLTISGREFAPGDRVVCLRNSDLLGIKNGTRATVESVHRKARRLTITTDAGERVELAKRYLSAGHLRHAYAITGHSGQGVTVERAFVLASGQARRLQEWGYVALSRAREETRLYVTANARERESDFHDLDDRDPLSRFSEALEESAIERLAIDQRPLPAGPKHGARAEIARPKPTHEQRAKLRLIEQQRLALLRTRADAERKLGQAEQKLESLGGLRNRRRRAELESELALRSAAIRVADQKLAALADSIRDSRRTALRLSERSLPDERKSDPGRERADRYAGELELRL